MAEGELWREQQASAVQHAGRASLAGGQRLPSASHNVHSRAGCSLQPHQARSLHVAQNKGAPELRVGTRGCQALEFMQLACKQTLLVTQTPLLLLLLLTRCY